MKPVQYFSDEYLQQCKKLTPDQIIQFLDDFRQLHGHRTEIRSRSKLISLKVPEDLLNVFKKQAMLAGTPYQTQIKALMTEWVLRPDSEDLPPTTRNQE
jgi:predicted DNA binding CopG/RHH family protein